MKNRIEEITERVKKPIMEILSKEGIGNIDLYSGLKMAIRDWDKIHNRWLKLRNDFIEKGGYTPEMIQKVVALNDGLYERFKMVYQDVCDMHKKIEQEISDGQLKISGYCIYPEFFFAYNYDEGIPTADGDMLALMSDYTSFPTCFGLDTCNRACDTHKSFEELETLYDIHDGKNCSLLFDRYEDNEELNKYKIYYFMHEIFLESHTFCVADIPYLKPEDLRWQIKVEYEKLGEPLRPLKNGGFNGMKTKNNLEMENFMNELLRTELNQYFIKETPVEKIEKTESDVIINLAADYDNNLFRFYLREVGKMPLMTPEEENEALEIIKNKESEDVNYNQFICKELRIICAISKKYINNEFSFFGLIQVASIALIKAVEKIDYCKNLESFSDYLIWWVRNAIEQCIGNRIKAVKIPLSMLKILEPLENTVKQAKMI